MNYQSEQYINRIALPISDGLRFVKIQDIIYLKAEKAYTHIYLADGNKLFISKNLRTLEKLLAHPHFFRPHRSYLINLNHVHQYIRRDGGYIVMDGGNTVHLAQNRRLSFLQAYGVIN